VRRYASRCSATRLMRLAGFRGRVLAQRES
jgi:hypothetical protein